MKLNCFLSFCLLLLLASCSQQKFAFRHIVHVKNNQPTIEVVRQKQSVTVTNTPTLNLPNIKPSLPQKMEVSHVGDITRGITINKPTTLLTDTLKKKYKFDTEVTTPTEEKNGTKTAFLGESSQYDSAAVAGFVLGLLGWFYFLTAIPGFVLSIKGLKSRRNHGLAVAGLVLSSIFLAMLAIVIIFLIIIIGTYN